MKPYILILLVFIGAMLWTPQMQKHIIIDWETESDIKWEIIHLEIDAVRAKIHDNQMLINAWRNKRMTVTEMYQSPIEKPSFDYGEVRFCELVMSSKCVESITTCDGKTQQLQRRGEWKLARLTEVCNEPTCDSAHRGMQHDRVFICMKTETGYEWEDITKLKELEQ